MVAACRAKELGASALLLEKAGILGGDTALSSQFAQGFWQGHVDEGDSIDLYIEDTKKAHWATEKGKAGVDLPADFPLSRALLENQSAMFDWAEKNGMEWFPFTTKHQAWYPQPQWDTKASRNFGPKGGSLLAVLQKVADKLGVEIMKSTPVYDLIVNSEGRVVGVRAFDADDNLLAIKANKAVILATGGFNASGGMMSRYLPVQGQNFCGGCTGNTGDGHRMVESIGGKLRDMSLGSHWMVYDDVSNTTVYNSAVASYGGTPDNAEAADYPFIMVNFNGQRFMAETMGYKWTGAETNKQPFHMNYMVFDSGEACSAWWKAVLAFGTPEYSAENRNGIRAFSENSLAELARDMQVPADALAATVAKYNGFVEAGKDTDFNKSMRKVSKLETPPFRALRMRPRHYTTYGGIAIDTEGHVLNTKGKIIPSLYAAGTCCGSVWEQEGLYYQGGVGQTLTFGYLTAAKAVKEEAWK